MPVLDIGATSDERTVVKEYTALKRLSSPSEDFKQNANDVFMALT